RERVEFVIETACTDSKCAQVVTKHHLISDGLGDIALEPNSRCIRWTEELVGNMPAINAEPERKIPFCAANTGKRRNTCSQCEVVVKCVTGVASDNDLRALALRRIGGPCVKKVAKLRIQHPSQKLDLHFLQLKVVALLHVLHIAERVGVIGVQSKLIQVSCVGVDADAKVTMFRIRQFVAEVWSVATIRRRAVSF